MCVCVPWMLYEWNKKKQAKSSIKLLIQGHFNDIVHKKHKDMFYPGVDVNQT